MEIHADYKSNGFETHVAIGCYEMPCWPFRVPETFNPGPYMNAIIYIGSYSSHVSFEILKFHGHGGRNWTLKESNQIRLVDSDNDGYVDYIVYMWTAYNTYNLIEAMEEKSYEVRDRNDSFPHTTFRGYLESVLEYAEDMGIVSIREDGKIVINELTGV
jgi:hypothetical protein